MEEGETKPRPKVLFEVYGEVVRVIDGPSADFNGFEDVNYDKSRLRVSSIDFWSCNS